MDSTPPPRGTYAGHEPVTPDEIARIDAALERTQGNRAHAAVVAGVDPKRVENVVQKDATLRVKWGKHKRTPPEGVAGELDRADPVGPFSQSDRKAALAVRRQDALLGHSWKAAGFKEGQIAFLESLQKSYATNVRGTIDLVYGGAAHTATRLLMVFEELVKKIEDIDANPDAYERIHRTEFGQNVVKSAHEFRCELYDRLISISGELRKVNTDLTKANWIRIQIQKLESGEGDQMKRKKQGWSSHPIQVHAAPGSNVTVVENPPRADEPEEISND